MKKIFVHFSLIVFLAPLLTPGVGLAQTGASIQAQLELIANLQKKLQELQAQVLQIQTQQKEAISAFLTTLREGSQGEKVETLQALLAADPEIYPEGLITGFYGKLTAKAVKKFQKRHGLEQVGFIGPKTLKKLNEFLEEHPLAFEEADDDDDDKDNDKGKDRKKVMIVGASGATVSLPQGEARLCAIVPPGHLIAPGWLRKQGGVRPIVPLCQVLPPGILKLLGATSTPTSTPDTVAPVISGIAATPSSTSAVLTWLTNESADSEIRYGTSTSYGLTASSPTLVTSHSLTLSGLTTSTTYHFHVKSRDAVGNVATSSDQVFTTLAASSADTTAPVISSISVTPSSTSALVSWTTNEPATSKVYYSASTPVNLSTASSLADAALVTSHSLALSGLAASSTYYYVVESQDSPGNAATSSQQSFVTTP